MTEFAVRHAVRQGDGRLYVSDSVGVNFYVPCLRRTKRCKICSITVKATTFFGSFLIPYNSSPASKLTDQGRRPGETAELRQHHERPRSDVLLMLKAK